MDGETNLHTLLATMQPVLQARPYIFMTMSQATYDALPFAPLGTFWEQEGITVIATQEQANAHGLPFEMSWACITLMVHSSLSAVGFLATIIAPLAQAGISVNPVSAYHHDHLFVPWERHAETLHLLEELSKQADHFS